MSTQLRGGPRESLNSFDKREIYNKAKVGNKPAFDDIFHGTGSCLESRIRQRNHEAGSSAKLSGLMYYSASTFRWGLLPPVIVHTVRLTQHVCGHHA